MATFEFRNAQEIGRVLKHHDVRYLFFGKSGAILLGYSDTTQDVDLYVEKEAKNCRKLVGALLELASN
jgi:predicted nucleotidyltransferase